MFAEYITAAKGEKTSSATSTVWHTIACLRRKQFSIVLSIGRGELTTWSNSSDKLVNSAEILRHMSEYRATGKTHAAAPKVGEIKLMPQKSSEFHGPQVPNELSGLIPKPNVRYQKAAVFKREKQEHIIAAWTANLLCLFGTFGSTSTLRL